MFPDDTLPNCVRFIVQITSPTEKACAHDAVSKAMTTNTANFICC